MKITGDECIRAGEITWSGTFASSRFPVKVHTFDHLFRTNDFSSATAEVRDISTIVVATRWWTLTFRRNES